MDCKLRTKDLIMNINYFNACGTWQGKSHNVIVQVESTTKVLPNGDDFAREAIRLFGFDNFVTTPYDKRAKMPPNIDFTTYLEGDNMKQLWMYKKDHSTKVIFPARLAKITFLKEDYQTRAINIINPMTYMKELQRIIDNGIEMSFEEFISNLHD